MAEENKMTLNVNWSGKQFVVDLNPKTTTLTGFKRKLEELTDIQPENQKLIGIKLPAPNVEQDSVFLDSLALKHGQKVMLVGTPGEKKIIQVPQEGEGDVLNDLDIDYNSKDTRPLWEMDENQKKLQQRLSKAKIVNRNPLREGKKLVVLDIDYTLFDHRSVAEKPQELARPYLHEFLTEVYEYYDIALWSATSMKWIDVKMTELKVYENPNYKIAFALDATAMISVVTEKHGVHEIKPLQVIWHHFKEHYGPHNTIHIDDLTRNFGFNPKNGLKIPPYRNSHRAKESDHELHRLSQYLISIAKSKTPFDELTHKEWYKP